MFVCVCVRVHSLIEKHQRLSFYAPINKLPAENNRAGRFSLPANISRATRSSFPAMKFSFYRLSSEQ